MNAVLEALGNLGFDWHIALANLINFALIFFILKVLFFEKIRAALTKRQKTIEEGLKKAHEGELLLQNVRVESEGVLKGARMEADHILSDAKEQGKKLVQKSVDLGLEKQKEIVASAEKKFDLLKKEQEEELRRHVPQMAAQMVEQILKEKANQAENASFIKRAIR